MRYSLISSIILHIFIFLLTIVSLPLFNAPKLDIKVPGLNKTIYKNFSGICLEAQMFPDSVNQPKFPSIISSPENPYFQKTEIEII